MRLIGLIVLSKYAKYTLAVLERYTHSTIHSSNLFTRGLKKGTNIYLGGT